MKTPSINTTRDYILNSNWQYNMQNNIYDTQFRRNILIVGKTGCGKTHFVQKLGLNNFFDRIVKTDWVSSIPLSNSREAEI